MVPESPLCLSKSQEDDEKRYIIKRYEHVFVILNLYPYNAGHLMVVPFEHKGTLGELSPETRAELIEVTALSEKVLKEELHADGLNIGLNLGGKSAGGTIPNIYIYMYCHVFMGILTFYRYFPIPNRSLLI